MPYGVDVACRMKLSVLDYENHARKKATKSFHRPIYIFPLDGDHTPESKVIPKANRSSRRLASEGLLTAYQQPA
jgi:hypothetical protein